jgi:hypothetical protein
VAGARVRHLEAGGPRLRIAAFMATMQLENLLITE